MTPNATATFLVGNTLDVLRTLPDASVDLVCSSPPFLSVRSYLPPGHLVVLARRGSRLAAQAIPDGPSGQRMLLALAGAMPADTVWCVAEGNDVRRAAWPCPEPWSSDA